MKENQSSILDSHSFRERIKPYQNKKIMKKLMLIGFAIIMALTICDCSYKPTTNPLSGLDDANCRIVTVDSCEYIHRYFRGAQYGFLVHKGNCRFCRERRQKEIQDLIIALKEN